MTLDVPQLSQEIHRGEYPEFDNGGEAWCSPTSSSMVLGYWKMGPKSANLQSVIAPNGDPQVDWAAMHTYDFAYEGAGNWPFNSAYSASFGLKSFVTRMQNLAEAETYIAAGIPLVASVAFTRAELPQAGYSTNGHLLVIVGFTAAGDVIVNDPYSPTNEEVRRIYPRANFEQVWLNGSNGTAYITLPQGHPLPGEASPVSPVAPTGSTPANPEPTPTDKTSLATQPTPTSPVSTDDQQGISSSSGGGGRPKQQLAQTGSAMAAWHVVAAAASGAALIGLFTVMVGRRGNARRCARSM
nr:C39 family peptidase [Pseudoclavibacter sp. 13-3]